MDIAQEDRGFRRDIGEPLFGEVIIYRCYVQFESWNEDRKFMPLSRNKHFPVNKFHVRTALAILNAIYKLPVSLFNFARFLPFRKQTVALS